MDKCFIDQIAHNRVDRVRTPAAVVRISDKVKACRLWPGSMLDLMDRHGGGVTYEALAKKLADMARCDDRTPAENEFMLLLLEAAGEGA